MPAGSRSRSFDASEKTPILSVNDDDTNQVPSAAATMGSFVTPLRSAMKDPSAGSSNKSVSWSDKSGDSLYIIKAVPSM